MRKYRRYSEEVKKEVIRLHLDEGRTKKSLSEEYGLGAGTLSNWLKNYREECSANQEIQKEYDSYERNKQLLRENAELRKENEFLKKAAAFFAKEID